MIDKLMRDTVKADESKLPQICSLDWEFNLSSIFVEVDTPLVNIVSYILFPPREISKFYSSIHLVMYRDFMALGALPH